MKIIKSAFVLLFVLCCVLFASCNLYPSIVGLEIEDTASIDLSVGEATSDMTLIVTGTSNWQLSDIRPVVEDELIARVEYEKDAENPMFVSFRIVALKNGSTDIFFETTDKKISSAPLTVTVEPEFTSVEFLENEEITLYGLEDEIDLPFAVKNGDTVVACPVDLIFASENPTVVAIAYVGGEDGTDFCRVLPISYGETCIYIRSADGKICSEKIKVTVIKEYDGPMPDFVLNTSTKKIHHPDCYTIRNMNPENRQEVWGAFDEYLAQEYTKCNTCFEDAEKTED